MTAASTLGPTVLLTHFDFLLPAVHTTLQDYVASYFPIKSAALHYQICRLIIAALAPLEPLPPGSCKFPPPFS